MMSTIVLKRMIKGGRSINPGLGGHEGPLEDQQ
jgi:hypothetical protein